MAPPLSNTQTELLKEIYYEKKVQFGRNKLFEYLKTNHPDSGISRRQLWDFLSSQKVHQVFQAKKKQTSIRPIVSNQVNNIWQIDLIDFSNIPDNKFNYILNVIDTLSRKMWLFAIRNKTVENIEKALIELFKEAKPKVISSDQGNEFKIDFERYNIKHITSQPYSPMAQGIIERSNGVIKTILKKQMYINQNNRWLNLLDTVEDNYNNTINATTKKTPNELYNSSIEKQTEIATNIKNEKAKGYAETDTVLKVGEKVRVIIPKKKGKLDQNYTDEIFTINKVISGSKESSSTSRYQLIDENNVIIKGYYSISRLLVVKSIEEAPSQKQIEKKYKKLSRAELAGISQDNIIDGKRKR